MKSQPRSRAHSKSPAEGPFAPGAVVLVTLLSPREKFWGAILSLAPSGLALRGISLVSFEDFAAQLRLGEGAHPLTLFFPMHRVERIELDVDLGDVPSLSHRFEQITGIPAARLLAAERAGR